MKHLYLMRHGETLFNVRRKIQGWCDSPLTQNGVNQALAAKTCLKDIHFDHYYSSTSERCCDTLDIVTDYKVTYKRLKQLKERNFGSFEGESEDLNPQKNCGLDYDDIFPYYGGEYRQDVVDRMYHTLKDIMNTEDHFNVLAVSHGGACYAFLSAVVDNNTLKHFGPVSNCNIFHYVYENGEFQFIELIKPQMNGE